MDQASLLREMMSRVSKSKTETKQAYSFDLKTPLAMISAEKSQPDEGDFLKKTAAAIGRIALLGVKEKNFFNLQDYMVHELVLDDLKHELPNDSFYIPGSLDIVDQIRGDQRLFLRFVDLVQQLEETSEQIIYFAGDQLNASTINMAVMSPAVVILADPSEESLQEVLHYVKIFSKMRPDMSAGLVMNTKDNDLFQKESERLQEKCRSAFNYTLEPIGCCASDEVSQNLLRFATRREDESLFSESLIRTIS